VTSPATSAPPIGVIVRTLGRPRLGEALDSLLGQTRLDFETVIVDMSGGRAAPVVAERAARLPHLRHVVLPGPLNRANALNLGVTRSTAATLAILDDDNLYTPAHLDTLVRGLASSGADLAYTGVTRQTLTPDGGFVHAEPTHARFDSARLLFGNFIYATGTAFRREIWEKVGGYDPRFPVYEDWEYLIRVAHAGRIVALPVVSGISRSFTGDPSRPSHRDEADDCARCAAGLFWVHREKYTPELFERHPELVRAHPEVPLGGTRPAYEPLVASWMGQCDRIESHS
jgi:glycosyltransferase involved in cell wall biosynthesis